MSIKFIRSHSHSLILLWLSMAIAALAQDNAPVLDTKGDPLLVGEEYYIEPAITDVGGRVTLVDRDGNCPLYVGQQNGAGSEAYPVIFRPFAEDESVVRVNRDTKIIFSAITLCIQSTEWLLGQNDTESGRRLIITGNRGDERQGGNYFRVTESQIGGNIYNLEWCPVEACPFCRFICGTAGGLFEDGKILLALDGNVLPVMFVKKE
ncbi:hypothetical protein L6164_022718 [Bauhinia variegata]|uniref:Uncharacterized protein n=1 Tax=Bauhinia variegata TaxID=167791 RepID=A0ACB9MFZ7_BAUVA|nr:hypothetical protein L6164_022718 [Bauhinia variegata]